jgi:hypothetical protein
VFGKQFYFCVKTFDVSIAKSTYWRGQEFSAECPSLMYMIEGMTVFQVEEQYPNVHFEPVTYLTTFSLFQNVWYYTVR